MNLDDLLLTCDSKAVEDFIPEITPVSIRDMEHMPPMDMHIHMSDPCPECEAFNMLVGDYACYGMCGKCYSKQLEEIGTQV